MGDIAIFLDNLRWQRISTNLPDFMGRDNLRWYELIYCSFTFWPMIFEAWAKGQQVPVGIMIVGKPMSKRERERVTQEIERLSKLYP